MQQRVTAAAAQISSLNPLVELQTITTTEPLIPSGAAGSASSSSTNNRAVDWLRQEAVNVVVACDLPQSQMVSYAWYPPSRSVLS